MAKPAQPNRPPLKLRSALPLIWELMAPRKGLLILGLGLMAINCVAVLVLCASTKWLNDDVIGERHLQLLAPLVCVVVIPTQAQGIFSFALTHSLSMTAQRVIA